VISLPGVAACPCAASGSAQQASTAVVAMIRFNIVRSSCSEYTERKTPHVRGRPAVVSRVPYVPTGGSRLAYIGRHERRLSSTPGGVWPGVGGRGRGYDRLHVGPRRRVPRDPLQRAARGVRGHPGLL